MTIDRQQFLDELKLREQIRRAISIIGERKAEPAGTNACRRKET